MAHAMPPSVVARLRAMPGNKRCVDCLANNPQWASVSFGALLCLECSGKHRGLGVHISFVRSVQMDSWSAKQIKMMEVGGNGKLRQWFEKHGVLDLPTSDKYNTPEAELYRERILALREGRTPPTKLAEPRTSASSGSSAAPAASRPPPGETPVERELRLRREAGERLRAKFGDKGLKGTFVTNSPMAMGGGGNTTSNNGTPDIAQAAGMAWTTLASYVQLGAAKAAQATSSISNQLAEAQLGEKVKTGVAGISSKLADPALSEKAKATASSLWGGALSGATSLWQKASTLTNDFSRTFADPAAAAAPPRPSQTRRAAAAAPTSRASNGYGVSAASGNGVRGRARSRGHSGGGAESGDWMASELSKAKRELGLKPKPAAAAGWEDGDDWDDDWGDGPATRPAAAATTATTARATSNAGEDDNGWDSWSEPAGAAAADAAAPLPPTQGARAAKSAAAAPPSLPPAAAAAPAAGSNSAVDDSDDWDEDWGDSAEPAGSATSAAAAAAAAAAAHATAEVNPAEPADDDDWGDDWGDDIDSLEPAALKAVSLS